MLKKAIIIADSSELFRRGLSELLRGEGYDIAGVVGTGEDALELAAANPGGLMLVDECLETGGGELIGRIRAEGCRQDAIVLSAAWDLDTVIEALVAGASGFVDKDSAPEQLFAAIELVSGGGLAFSGRPGLDLLDGLGDVFDLLRQRNRRRLNLTKREAEVLGLLPTSFTLGQIAAQLFVSRKTVQNNVSSLYRKLEVGARAEAVAEAIRLGLITPAAFAEQGRSRQ
jgi:DNA-binding NarL/FixJ family response regulator